MAAAFASLPATACDCAIDAIREGSTRDDQILDAAALTRGFVLVGYEHGTLGEYDWPLGDAVAFVEHRNDDGTLRWRREIQTAGTDLAEVVAVAPDGTIWVAGRTTGALPDAINRGSMDGFIVAFDPGGVRLHELQYGDERPQHPTALLVDGTDVTVVGYDDIHVAGSAVEDWENATVTRFSHAGGALRQVSHWRSPRASNDLFVDAVAGEDGRLFLLEHNYSPGALGGGIHLREWDAGNVERRLRTLSNHPLDVATQLLIDDTRLVVTGSAVTGLGGIARGYSQGFALALDRRDLTPQWSTQLPSDDAAWVGAAYLRDGATTLVAIVGDASDPALRSQLLAARIDAQGNLQQRWQTPAAAAAGYASDYTILMPACGGMPLLAGAVAGPLGNTRAIGATDRLLQRLPTAPGFCDGFAPIPLWPLR